MVFMYHYHHIMGMLSMRDLSHCIGQPGMMRGITVVFLSLEVRKYFSVLIPHQDYEFLQVLTYAKFPICSHVEAISAKLFGNYVFSM